MRYEYGRKTREPRRLANAPAWITKDGAFGVEKCVVLDTSRGGAQVKVDDPTKIPKEFSLTYSLSDRRGRRCRIIWRNGQRIGVKYVG